MLCVLPEEIAELESHAATIPAEGTARTDGMTPGQEVLQILVAHGVFVDLVPLAVALPRQERRRRTSFGA